MADDERIVCDSGALANSGKAVRFEVAYFGDSSPAFVVRYAGRVYGYLNRCSHLPMELDWREGEVFDSSGRDLICSTHGATYAADSGRCVGGPCGKTPLVALRIEERDGKVYFKGIDDG
ncbi:MAG: Rieske 2Fe-2S domain-containing protein [Candidatus Parcubacteria bacterium]|nr:Rieske 2Fe-2S domain-containing protein [Burkholderiales bacterium]